MLGPVRLTRQLYLYIHRKVLTRKRCYFRKRPGNALFSSGDLDGPRHQAGVVWG